MCVCVAAFWVLLKATADADICETWNKEWEF